jgi:phospholipid/cholesterol/gamma-HCH transport system substrate-binding protein
MNKPRFEVAVGFFVVLGFLILSMIVFFVSGVFLFRPGYHLKAEFDFVGIINQGAPVRFSGVRVGEVTGVDLIPPAGGEAQPRVAVTFFVERDVQVYEHYEISVRGTHIMSEPHIMIIPVAGEGRLLKDGDLVTAGISPYSMDQLFAESENLLEGINSFMEDIESVLGDPETRDALGQTFQNMSQLLASMNQVVGGNEEEMRAVFVNMNRVGDQMTELLERINQAEGTVGKLLTEDEIYNDLRDLLKDIKAHPWKLLKKK